MKHPLAPLFVGSVISKAVAGATLVGLATAVPGVYAQETSATVRGAVSTSSGEALAGATVIVPLETFLPGQLTIAVDGGAAKRYNYQFCNQIGCIAQIGLTQADVDAFRAGNAATVTIIPAQAPDQPISLNMSLTGFTAGYNVVDVVSNQ